MKKKIKNIKNITYQKVKWLERSYHYHINFRGGIVVPVPLKLKNMTHDFIVSRVAQWQRAGPITQRSEDQNLALLRDFTFCYIFLKKS